MRGPASAWVVADSGNPGTFMVTRRMPPPHADLARACKVCGTSLSGPGAAVLRLAGIARSARNPNVCTRCNTHFEAGELREVTVLFADLSGFTALTHEVGPERTHAIVDAFLRRASELVVAEDGVVDKFIGDAVMAVFNVPIARTDHALRAFRAAQAIQASMPALSERFGRNLEATVGMARGHARLGALGGPGDHTLLGDVVNLAARLQGQARPGEILLDDEVQAGLDGYGEPLTEARIQLKGFPEPVTFYRSGAGGPVTPSGGGGGIAQPRLGFGAVAFALLGAPCAAVTALSPVALWLGIGTAAGSVSILTVLDRPLIRIPMMVLAGLGATANLAAAHRASRLRRALPRGGFLPSSNTDRNRTRWALALSGLTLLILLAELLAHAYLHPHP